MTGSNHKLELIVRYRDICILAAYGNLNITVWTARGDASAVHAIDEPLMKRIPMFPQGVSGVHIVTEVAGLPSAGARDALAEGARRWAEQTAAVAVVIEHQGFAGSAMRGVVTGIQMLARTSFPIHAFRSLDEAAGWLPGIHRDRTGVTFDRGRLHQALTDARKLALSPDSRPAFARPSV